jgi:hypothetical protein
MRSRRRVAPETLTSCSSLVFFKIGRDIQGNGGIALDLAEE